MENKTQLEQKVKELKASLSSLENDYNNLQNEYKKNEGRTRYINRRFTSSEGIKRKVTT